MKRKDTLTPMERRNRARLHAEGRTAFRKGEARDNPRYRAGTAEHHWFAEGWELEQQLREQLRHQGGAA